MTERRAIVARWLLVLVIGIGVVAMHSLVGTGRPSLATVHAGMSHRIEQLPRDMPGHGQHDGSSMLGHLCLAVLGLVGLALLVLPMLLAVLRRHQARVGPVATWSPVSSRPRAPPPTSPRLAELCVSRC